MLLPLSLSARGTPLVEKGAAVNLASMFSLSRLSLRVRLTSSSTVCVPGKVGAQSVGGGMCRSLSDTVGDAIYISRMPWERGTLSPARDGEWGQLSGRPRLPVYPRAEPCLCSQNCSDTPSGLHINIISGEMVVNTPLNSAAVRCLGLYSQFCALTALIVHVVVHSCVISNSLCILEL